MRLIYFCVKRLSWSWTAPLALQIESNIFLLVSFSIFPLRFMIVMLFIFSVDLYCVLSYLVTYLKAIDIKHELPIGDIVPNLD